MILISTSPLALRRNLVLPATILALSVITSFGQPILFPVKSTPYDRQMERIEPILNCLVISSEHQIPLAMVDHWIRDLRAIPYRFSMQWKTPLEVGREAVADCKGKAVALYQQLQANGAQNFRLIIGKRTATSTVTHAWVEWTSLSTTYVLDPTINQSACSLAEIPNNSYIAYYAYTGTRKYCVANPGGFLAAL